jgi:hypothetical protein
MTLELVCTQNTDDVRIGKPKKLRYTMEQVMLPLTSQLKDHMIKKYSVQSLKSMRDTPSNARNFLQRPQWENVRKVRFAKFDVVHFYAMDSTRKQDRWWSQEELNDNHHIEGYYARRDPSAINYMVAYNEAFREVCFDQNVSSTNVSMLAIGGALGYRGLENEISRKCLHTRRLDVRCTVRSIVALQSQLLQNLQPGSYLSNVLRAHSEALTRSHRKWSAIIGELDNISINIDSV